MAVYDILNGMQPIPACEPLPVGQVVSYEDRANPLREYIVVDAEPGDYGQRCITRDGEASSTVNRSKLEGLGGWSLVGRIASAGAVAYAKREHERIVEEREAARRREREDRQALAEVGREWIEKNKPGNAVAVIVAEYEIDDCDTMTDYFNVKRGRRVLLAWSRHNRNLFSEMRKAAARFDRTAELADAPKSAEHRDNYARGAGNYLKAGGHYSSGWTVRKLRLDWHDVDLTAGRPEDRAPLELASRKPEKAAAEVGIVSQAATVEKRHHDKRGRDIYVVTLPQRVDRDAFESLRDRCKAAGGWYCRAWRGESGGFAFERHPDAEAFAKSIEGSEPAPRAKSEPNIVGRLRELADRMQPTIDAKLAPCSQNWTPKRGRQTASRNHDGRNLERCQAALRALADAREDGTLPAELDHVKTKSQALRYVSTRPDTSGGYYCYHDTGEPSDTSDAAVALRTLVETRKSEAAKNAEQERQRAELLQRKIDAQRGNSAGGFFPTPPAIAQRVIDAASITQNDNVLEPSAGIGTLAELARESGGLVQCVEIAADLCEILELKGFATFRGDFATFAETGFDRVVMNPPFEKRQDFGHAVLAADKLKPGGRLVAIMTPRGFEDFRDWAASEPLTVSAEALPDGWCNGADAFHRTGVASVLVTADRERGQA